MRWILFITSLPMSLASWLLACLAWIFQFSTNLRWEENYVLAATWRQWFFRHWGYSTTFGRAVIYAPNHHPKAHEHVHVRQMVDENTKAFVVGSITGLLTWNVWLWIIIWCSGMLWILLHYVTAMLRYGVKHMYRDAEHERAAYAQTDVIVLRNLGESWLERRERIKG